MSDINKIFKEAVEGFEAPHDASIWENISSELSPMEDAFRESVNGHEVPYNPGAWSAIKNQIGTSSTLLQWIAGSAAAVTLVVGAVAFIPSENSGLTEQTIPSKIDSNAVIVFNENKTTENKIADNAITPIVENETVNNDQSEENLNEVVNASDNSLATAADSDTDNNIDHANNNTNDNDQTDPVITNNNGTDTTDPVAETAENNVTEPVNDFKYTADFSVSTNEVCAGDKILFNPKMVNGNAIYVWDFGDGAYSSESTASHVYELAGNFDVTLTIRDKNSNKVLASSKESVTINGLPNIEFTWEKDNAAIPTVDFINLTEEGKDWAWKVNGRMISDKNEFEYTFREKGMYTVELSASNANGCTNHVQEQIAVESDYDLFAPNAFSPNGDSQNETFLPKALLLVDKEFTMIIYNQGGNYVYSTQSANEPWDGRATDNTIAPSGSYIWVVTLKNGNGQIEEYTGQFTLIR